MKERITALAAALSLIPVGQPILIRTGAVLTSAAVMLSVPQQAKAESVDFLYKRGNRRQESGDFYGALSDFSRIIEMNPRDADAYYNRGNSKKRLKDYSGGIADYNRAIEINPSLGMAYNNRGNAKYRTGDKKGACDDFKKARSFGSKNSIEWFKTESADWCRNM